MPHAHAKTAKPEGQTEKPTSLRVSQPGDRLEVEADRVADEVLRSPVTGGLGGATGEPPVQRKCAACEAGGAPCPACSLSVGITTAIGAMGQLKRWSDARAKSVSNGSFKAVQAVRSGGSPLSDTAQDYFEPRFGRDFGQVRIHTGFNASDAARSLNSRAFTTGKDIVFGAGEYNLNSSSGRRLLAHELTHTIQQGSGFTSGEGRPIGLQRVLLTEENTNNPKIEEQGDVEDSSYDVLEGHLHPDTTSQSITPEYAAVLSDYELQSEMLAVADLLDGNDPQGFGDAWHHNLRILIREYFTRGVSADLRTPEQFQQGAPCYNRETESWTMVVDGHVHFKPFGGKAVPTWDLYDYFHSAGIMGVTASGIGQPLEESEQSPECTHYKDCPGVCVKPSMKNDIENALDLTGFDTGNVNTIISRSFPDLENPQMVMGKIRDLDSRFPNRFKGMGEVNLVKQAQFPNCHSATPKEAIKKWSEFMAFLLNRKMPIMIHADLGSDLQLSASQLMPPALQQMRELDHHGDHDVHESDCKGHACHRAYGTGPQSRGPMKNPLSDEPMSLDDATNNPPQTQHLDLFKEVLKNYPHNKIIWVHMGLSEELVSINPDLHIQILTDLLNTYPNLMLDISWKVLFENYFDPEKHPIERAKYVRFFNTFPTRILTGSDFVANENKTLEDYQELVRLNSDILKDLDDEAFKQIALGGNYYRLYSTPEVAPSICAYSTGRRGLVDWVQDAIPSRP